MTTSVAQASLEESSLSTTLDMVRNIRADLLEHYTSTKDNVPWIVTYSGGKDSTTILHFVLEMMLDLGSKKCNREVHVVSNDTLVESPLVNDYLHKSMANLNKFLAKANLPISTKITKPYINDSFWFNLIGKGYPTPNRQFRWCTSRLKIDPTTRYIKEQVNMHGEVCILLGTRYSESSGRSRSIKNHKVEGSYFNKHSTLKNCKVAIPIADMTDDDVWIFLMQNRPPWGGTYRNLITLYKNARGGECPTMLSTSDAPACGSTSPRFGCWTCTVVEKDRSLEGLVDSGHEEFEPLIEFRNWLMEIRNNSNNRLPFSRQGRTRVSKENINTGPFTLETRRVILDKLLSLQQETRMDLISTKEVFFIKRQWERDESFIDLIHQE